jgi:hypothetical protein
VSALSPFIRWRTAGVAAALAALLLPAAATAATSSAARSADAWTATTGTPAASRNGARPEIRPRRFRALTVDRAALAAVLDGAPHERSRAGRTAPLTISLPSPGGGFERFAIQQASVMEPGLAARHPEIATYAGTSIDTPGATVHLDLTPLGFHASVRGPDGAWYVDPYYAGDDCLYISYRGADLVDDPHGGFVEREPPSRVSPGKPFGLPRSAAGPPVSLRTYRLALASDPAYASYPANAADVTAAKATLISRVNQLYEDDFGIHLSLVANNDVLNLDTAAAMTGANGPCGAAACYTAAQAAGCDVATLDRTRIVLGQLVGASNYDIGHIGMGVDSGGIAYVGVVGASHKGGGCTGVDTPVGDLFAVDYVAHEMGHQFAAGHTFNGVSGSCAGNGGGPAVEPGSGVTVMGYAGICATDDLQPHADPYFSQRSIDQVTSYAGAPLGVVNEVQTVSLRDFAGTDSFRLTYKGAQSAAITSGTTYNAAGIVAAIKAIAGFPAAATVTATAWGSTAGAPGATGFTLTFGGSLAGTDVAPLTLTSPVGMTGFVGETTQGGAVRNGGAATATANRAPVVDAPVAFTIPTRTPFALTGSATDADGDTLTYLWEQNDAGAGTALSNNTKTGGPLFRVFGTAAAVTPADTLLSPSPGENVAGTLPVRVFPDLAQVLADNTNAATGSCPAAPLTPAKVDCYSEFLPTSAYTSAMHFRLTARDGNALAGGVGHGDTTVTVAPAAGPFRVTSQASASTVNAGAPLTVTWSVAGTNAAPVSAANVRITMSTDGGLTFGRLVTPATPNDGSQVVFLPNADTTQARIRIEGAGSVFFDVNRAAFTVLPGAPVVTNDAPAGGVQAQVAQMPAPVTIAATDENTPGSSLTASASGLPDGLMLTAMTSSPGAATPGGATWTIGGQVTGAPGTYPVEVTVADGSGRVGLTFFDVVVAAPPPPPPPPVVVSPPPPIGPPPLAPPPPAPAAPRRAVLAPDLGRVAKRLRLSATGRVRLALRCKTLVSGATSPTCSGSVRLTARIGAKKRTVASATFSFSPSTTKSLRVRLSAKARRAIKSPRSASLTAFVPGSGPARRTATKAVVILAPRH